MRKSVFGLLPLLFISTSVYAQDNGDITGRVISWRDNQPLALVQIALRGTSYRTVTADDGTFRIAGVGPGSYVLQASTVGYYVLTQEFIVSPGETKNLEVVLVEPASAVGSRALLELHGSRSAIR